MAFSRSPLQGKKLKAEQEIDAEDEGVVTDEDEAADIDQEAVAAAAAEKAKDGAEEAPSTSTSPPVKKKDKKPKKVSFSMPVIVYALRAYPAWSVPALKIGFAGALPLAQLEFWSVGNRYP